MARAIKLSSRLQSSRPLCSSSFQTERVRGSVCSDQTMYFQLLVPILKYIVLISFIVPEICLLNYVTPCIRVFLKNNAPRLHPRPRPPAPRPILLRSKV